MSKYKLLRAVKYRCANCGELKNQEAPLLLCVHCGSPFTKLQIIENKKALNKDPRRAKPQ